MSVGGIRIMNVKWLILVPYLVGITTFGLAWMVDGGPKMDGAILYFSFVTITAVVVWVLTGKGDKAGK